MDSWECKQICVNKSIYIPILYIKLKRFTEIPIYINNILLINETYVDLCYNGAYSIKLNKIIRRASNENKRYD